MRKTNSKEVRAKVRKFIVEGFNPEYAPEWAKDATTLEDIATAVIWDFHRVTDGDYFARRYTLQERFSYYASTLPCIINTDYYNDCTAVDLVGGWLEQTDVERNKYSESDACKLADYLIFSELTKHAKRL